ncbi:MAG: putative membrane protein SirB2 [Candidatus Azotimanducaceae bacterium]|jgi:uncharacterized membrane protein SirB2
MHTSQGMIALCIYALQKSIKNPKNIMNTYESVLAIHIVCAIFSITIFTIRAYWMLGQNILLQHPITRILPHIIDTALLSAAIVLTIIIQQFPGQSDWLSVKVVALVIYILFGTIALKRGKTMKVRVTALIFAWLTFAFIVSVAIFHHPAGVFITLMTSP